MAYTELNDTELVHTLLDTERELIASLADALVPAVPCFKAHWWAMAREAIRLLHEQQAQRAQPVAEATLSEDAAAPAGEAAEGGSLPPLYRPALDLMRLDLQML